MEHLILARHAETEWNVQKLVNGDPGTRVGLTPKGRDEARRLGEEIAGDAVDVCVVTPFARTHETADIALDGRDVARVVIDELGDPFYGSFEGGPLDVYREWAWSQPSAASPPGGGESRAAIVDRYARGFRRVLELPHANVLVVCHSLPVAYALAAREGRAPERKMPLVANAHPYRLDRAELERAIGVLEGWCSSPTW